MDPEALQRFQQEAAFLSRFRQPNIVSVYGFGQEAWSAPRAFSLADEKWFAAFGRTSPVKTFIAMEWVEGRTLDEVFWAAVADPDRQPSVRTIVRWMAEAAGVLAAVHAAGLIHRDVKPHNIMVAAGPQDVTAATTAAAVADADARHVKLMDFGIARQQRAERTLVTESGRVMGTPAYMSPEQIRAGDGDGDVGPASDVYSLCATFYELIAGRRMYRHDVATQDQVRTSKLGGHRPARLGTIARGVPWEVEALIMGGLEPEPADRHRSMEALERDLRRFLADEPIAYRTPSIARRAVLAYRRNRLVANLVGGFVVVALAGIVAYVLSIQTEKRRTGEQRDLAVRNGQMAEEQRRAADDQRAVAVAGEREARLRLADVQARNGNDLIDAGDPAGALLWYARSLPLVADAPDRDRLARLRLGMTLRLLPRPVATWDFATAAEPVATMSAVVTADGRRVVVADTSRRDGAEVGRARVLDAATGAEVARSAWHDGATGMATASRDGGRLATVTLGGVARTYEHRQVLATITRPGGVTRVVMAPGGDRLCVVSDSAHHVVEVVDPATGTPLFPPVRSDGPTAARTMFSDDGQTLLVATTAVGVRLVDAATGADRIPLVPVPMLWSAAISRDGRRFAAASGDGWGRAYDAATGEPLTPPLMHAGPVNRVEFDPAGTRLATAGTDKAVRVWSVEPGAVSPVNLPHPAAAFAVAFSPDGGRLITVAYDRALRAWDARTACRWPPRSARPRRSWTSRSGRAGATGSPSSPRPRDRVGLPRAADPGVGRAWTKGDVTRVAFDASSALVACDSTAGRVRVLRVPDGTDALEPLAHPAAVTTVEFSPDGARLLTACADGVARVWDVSAARRRRRDPAGSSTMPAAATVVAEFRYPGLRSARYRPGSRQVLTAGTGRDAPRLWDLAAPAGPIAAFDHGSAVRDEAFSADGRRLATAGETGGSGCGTRRRAAAGPDLKSPRRNAATVVRFSPDGRLVASAHVTGSLAVWDATTGALLAEPPSPNGPFDVAFNPDGSRFLACGGDDFVNLFETRAQASPSAVVRGGTFSAFAAFHPTADAVFASSLASGRLYDLGGAAIGPPLFAMPLGRGTFSPDGRWLVTLGLTLRVWDASPDARPAADLSTIAAVLSGRTIDDRGVLRPLAAGEGADLLRDIRPVPRRAVNRQDRGGREGPWQLTRRPPPPGRPPPPAGRSPARSAAPPWARRPARRGPADDRRRRDRDRPGRPAVDLDTPPARCSSARSTTPASAPPRSRASPG